MSLGHFTAWPWDLELGPFKLHKTSFLVSLVTLPSPSSPELMIGFPKKQFKLDRRQRVIL